MSEKSFFFYDLETSGVNPKESRIMQFAGQRTDHELKPIGEPANFLIKLTNDILPEPDAILITGITPQKTLAEGLSEQEFVELFDKEINLPDTTFVGFNNIRFDDEFMRYLFYRNFYEPYEWQWKDGRSRWDMLDVVRMMRALRPETVNWPFASDGSPTNRLELLTDLNKLDHQDAHDALSDVNATIAVAQMIRDKQPKLFDYLFSIRGKKQVAELIDKWQPFVYVSGKYSSEFEKATVVLPLIYADDKQNVLVYDLRHDPSEFIDLSPAQLAERWKWEKEPTSPRLPVKALKFNRCPAVAPLGVLSDENKKSLKIDLNAMEKHRRVLEDSQEFGHNLIKAQEILNADRRQTSIGVDINQVDGMLYEGFLGDEDRLISSKLRTAKPNEISDFRDKFKDERLKVLISLYKARNFPKHLDENERKTWEEFRARKLQDKLPKFTQKLGELAASENLTAENRYILEELQLYAESILPAD